MYGYSYLQIIRNILLQLSLFSFQVASINFMKNLN